MMTLTDAAITYIQKMLLKEQGKGFRLTIKKTGCSGYAYVPSILSEENLTDMHMEIKGINIFIDPTWRHLLEDLIVDCIDEEKSGLKQKRLVFQNPKEASRCGCGESFHVE